MNRIIIVIILLMPLSLTSCDSPGGGDYPLPPIAYAITSNNDNLFIFSSKDMYVIDVQDKASPRLLYHKKSWPMIVGAETQGNNMYVYGNVTHDNNFVGVIDISDPEHPVEISRTYMEYTDTWSRSYNILSWPYMVFPGANTTIVDISNANNPTILGNSNVYDRSLLSKIN